LVASGKAGKIKAVVFDEEQGTLEGIHDGVIYATVVLTPFDYGYDSAKLLYNLALHGEQALPPSGVIDTGFKVLHAADLPAFRALMAEESKW
jgi:ribose transport system substrate-binding protein